MTFSTTFVKFKNIYSLFAIFFFIVIMSNIIPNNLHFRTFIIYFLLLISVFLAILGYKTDKMIITGVIKFENDFIFLYDNNKQIINKHNLKDVNKVILWYVAFKGAIPNYSKNIIPSNGGNNEIKIKISNKYYKYTIFLENETDSTRFKMLYRFLKENNVNVHLKGF